MVCGRTGERALIEGGGVYDAPESVADQGSGFGPEGGFGLGRGQAGRAADHGWQSRPCHHVALSSRYVVVRG